MSGIPGRDLQAYPINCEEVWSLPEWGILWVLHSRYYTWPYPQTLDLAGKVCQEQTLQLIMNICKLQAEKVFNIGLGNFSVGALPNP